MKSLVIALPGMGNTILATPLIRELKKNHREMNIDLLVGLKSSEMILEGCPHIDNIYFIDTKINKNIFKTIKTILKLRKKHYDFSFTTFPAKQEQYNILSKVINAKKRITHNYKTKLIKFQNVRVPIKIVHDLKQNLNLLYPLGIKKASPRLELWLKSNKISKGRRFTVGIHPGSSIERGMIEKRWPPKYFSELIDLMLEEFPNYKFKLFIGPAEEDLIKIRKLSKNQDKIEIIRKGLKNTFSEIDGCDLFISNDSGLMHIAATQQVPTVGIFLSTDERRTFPFCNKKLILKKGEPHKYYRQNLENLKGIKNNFREKELIIIKPKEAMKEIKEFIKDIQ